jgi:hypothetical protein
VAVFFPSLDRLSQVLAGRRTVCLRHPHRYHVGQVDDHAELVGFLSARLRTWLLLAIALPLARLLVHRVAVAA